MEDQEPVPAVGSIELALASIRHGDVNIMPYRDRLNGWAVVRLLPNFQRVVVARFRTASDAEGHCRSLQRLIPEAQLIVVFDPPDETEIHAAANEGGDRSIYQALEMLERT